MKYLSPLPILMAAIAVAGLSKNVEAEQIEFPDGFEFGPINSTAEETFDDASCANNGACWGLADNCCPTIDGVFLYCCYEEPSTSFYGKEMTLVGSTGVDDSATYVKSTDVYTPLSLVPDDASGKAVMYTRNPDLIYDLVYYTIDFEEPLDYLNGTKKFFMDVFTDAPGCTQVLLQFENSHRAEGPYPLGRYARFVAYTTVSNSWERLEFGFVDVPDLEMVLDDFPVNALVLLFAPGTKSADTYYYRNLDSTINGCVKESGSCEEVAPKSCPAIIASETCNDGLDNDGDNKTDCEDLLCAAEPACADILTETFATASYQYQAAPGSSGAFRSMVTTMLSSVMIMGTIVMVAIL